MNKHIFTNVVIMIIISLFFMQSLSPAQVISEQKKAEVFTETTDLEFTMSFSFNDMVFSSLYGYDTVFFDDCKIVNDIGKPMLPVEQIRVALPAGMAVDHVSVVDTQSVVVDGRYDILPTQLPRKTDGSDDNARFIEPEMMVYGSSQLYPSSPVEFIAHTDLAGQGMGVFEIYPLQYKPLLKELMFHSSITFKISCEDGYVCGDYLSNSFSELEIDDLTNDVMDMVMNPLDVELHMSDNPQPLTLDPGDYDHVIISRSSDVTYWGPLAEWHTKRGLTDTVVTIDYIYSQYSGDNQQKVRSFVQDAYNTWGTRYILIAGEHSDVPFEYRTYGEDYIPSDEYYGDFDDDWTYEVYIGRSTARGITEVNRFIEKVFKYEKDPPMTNYILDATLLGMDLTLASDPPYYTLTRGELLKMNIDNNYIPSRFTITEVYDTEGVNHRSEFISALNDGQNLVNHNDHSYTSSMGCGDRNHGWYISSSTVDGLYNNDRMCNIFSTGCHPNEMDASDSISEHFVIYNSLQAGVSFT